MSLPVKITKEFANRLAALLRWAEPQMRRAGPHAQTPKRGQRQLSWIMWGKLLEDLHASDNGIRFLRWYQNSATGEWEGGDLDSGTPNTEGYIKRDVWLVDDNLLEEGEWLEEGRWCCIAANPQSTHHQVINWKGCPNIDGGGE